MSETNENSHKSRPTSIKFNPSLIFQSSSIASPKAFLLIGFLQIIFLKRQLFIAFFPFASILSYPQDPLLLFNRKRTPSSYNLLHDYMIHNLPSHRNVRHYSLFCPIFLKKIIFAPPNDIKGTTFFITFLFLSKKTKIYIVTL